MIFPRFLLFLWLVIMTFNSDKKIIRVVAAPTANVPPPAAISRALRGRRSIPSAEEGPDRESIIRRKLPKDRRAGVLRGLKKHKDKKGKHDKVGKSTWEIVKESKGIKTTPTFGGTSGSSGGKAKGGKFTGRTSRGYTFKVVTPGSNKESPLSSVNMPSGGTPTPRSTNPNFAPNPNAAGPLLAGDECTDSSECGETKCCVAYSIAYLCLYHSQHPWMKCIRNDLGMQGIPNVVDDES